jgi:hypothetical protein
MVQANKCDRCSHVWLADKPKRCSKCKSMRWNMTLIEQAIQAAPPDAVSVSIYKGSTKIVEQAIQSSRKEHDTKTCRVYRCGLCASAKG